MAALLADVTVDWWVAEMAATLAATKADQKGEKLAVQRVAS
jgi:hypothetical protein